MYLVYSIQNTWHMYVWHMYVYTVYKIHVKKYIAAAQGRRYIYKPTLGMK